MSSNSPEARPNTRGDIPGEAGACTRPARLIAGASACTRLPAQVAVLSCMLLPARAAVLSCMRLPARVAVLSCAVLIGMATTSTEADAQRVQGTVVDAESGAVIAGARITLLRAGGAALDSTFSDSAGAYMLAAPEPGRYLLQLEHLGFQPLTTDEFQIDDGAAVAVMELRATPDPIAMDELVVTGTPQQTAFERRRTRNTAGRFVTREQIDRRGSSRTTDLLREVAGVQVAGGGPGGWQGNVISMRGPRGRCEPRFFINGVPMGQRGENTIDQMIQPDMLEGIEIYTSSAATPPEFSQNGGCGVVAFWMRRAEGTRPFSFKRILVAGGLVGLILLLAQ